MKNSIILRSLAAILYVVLLFYSPLMAMAITIPLSVLVAKSSKTIIMSAIMVGLLFGLMAYSFTPQSGYDLVAHQREVSEYSDVVSIDGYFRVSGKNNLEPLPQLISYIISRTNDYDLLQASIVFISFTIIAYISLNYMSTRQMGSLRKIVFLLCMLLAQSLLYFFSGLYCYSALCLFALGFYCDYIKQHRWTRCVFYGLAILMHISMILPLAALIIMKVCKNKVSFRSIAIIIVVVLGLEVATGALSELFNIRIFNAAKNALSGYVGENAYYLRYYRGIYLVELLVELAIVSVAYLVKKDEKTSFSIILATIVVLLLPKTILMIRFIPLAFYISALSLIDESTEKTKKSLALGVLLTMMCVIGLSCSVTTLIPYGYNGDISEYIAKPIYEYFEK